MRVHLYPLLSVETYNQFLGRKSPTIQHNHYLIQHIKKINEHGRDIADVIETKNLSFLTHLHPNSRYWQRSRQWTHPQREARNQA